MTVRLGRKDWWGKPEPGDVRLDREGRVVKILGRKYSPDQPRVPAGSPEGGRWTSRETSYGIQYEWEGEGTGVTVLDEPWSSTAKIGGRALVEQHVDAIFKIVGSTDAYGKEHAFIIGADGKAKKPIKGSKSSVYLPDVEPGEQGAIHTHPGHLQDPGITTGPSPADVASHVWRAWDSGNENYTSVIVSLNTGGPEVRIIAISGWARGGNPKGVKDSIWRKIHENYGYFDWFGMSKHERHNVAERVIRDYVENDLGLKWEEWIVG